MAKYLDPKADVTFKKVFGEHKNLVISLLNALLPLDEGKKVESIEYLPPEMVPDNPDKKNSIVDVRCEETGGRKFIVEMQLNWTTAFKERVLFNAAKAYVRQIDRSDEFYLLQPVYSLNLVNKVFEHDTENCYHHYSMVHNLDTKKRIDGLHLVFVELPKFKPQSFAEKKMAVLWLKFLTEIDEKTRAAPQELLDNPEVAQALEIMEVAAYSDAELAAYDGYWDAVRVEATIMGELNDARADLLDAQAKVAEANARADAATAERDAAIEKMRQDKLQTARNLKSMNLPNEQIAAATGLAAGCDGWYSVVAGTLPELALRIVRAARRGDEAAALAESRRLAPLWESFARLGGSLRVTAASVSSVAATMARPMRYPEPFVSCGGVTVPYVIIIILRF